MAEFHPPEIEQAYKQATEGLVPELGLWDRIPDTEELEEMRQQADVLLAELMAEGMTQHPILTMRDGPEALRDRANQYVSMYLRITTGQAELKKDTELRGVIGFILQGLTSRPGMTQALMVSYEPNRIDSVPETIVVHPVTKSRDSRFSALAGWVTAKMLTPEIVDIILSDDTRVPPTLDDDWTKMILASQTNEVSPEAKTQ